MTRSAEPVDIVVAGGLVLTMDSKRRLYPGGSVAIAGDAIVDVGAKTARPAKTIIDARDCIVMPGFVNTHTHAAMVYFRGLADDLTLNEWLTRHIWPMEARYVRGPMVRDATELAAVEMIKSGTTLFNDMYFFEDDAAESVRKVGIRAMLGKALFSFPGPDGKSPQGRFRAAQKFVESFRSDPLIRPALAPHAPYTCSADLLREAKKLSDFYDVPCHIHLAETKAEVDDSLKKHGLTPPAYLAKLGMLTRRMVAVHCCWLTDGDIRLMKEHEIGIAHCPQSNMKLASGMAPVGRLLAAGIKLGLGTDGAASNNDLDMVDEMASAARVEKITTGDPTAFPVREVVAMATIGGARVLGLDHEVGSLEPGKKADIVIVDVNKPHLVPLYDAYSHLVYAAKGSDVKTVIVNGKVIMEKYELKTVDEGSVLAKAKKFAAGVMRKPR